jgi:tetratricopeptide (TPR) repeat protein
MPRTVTRPVPKKNLNYNPLYLISFVGLLGVIFFTPYFRGLFFKTEQQPVLVILSILFACWWFYTLKNKKFDLFTNPLDFAVTGVFLIYIISSFTAASQSLAVNEIVKNAIYFLVFWLVSRLVADEGKLKIVLLVILFSAVGVAMAGILTAMGWVHIKDGFLENMICSTMQYHNALAAYLLTVFLLGLALWATTEKNGKFLFSACNYIIFLTFFGANSRGAFLLVPVVFVLSLLNPYNKDKQETLMHWIIVGAGAVAGNIGLIPNIVSEKIGQAWLWFFAGLAITLVGQFLYNYLNNKRVFKVRIKGLHILIAIILLAIIFAFTWQMILPEHIVERIKAINLKELNAVERIYWSLEAFKMIKDNPLLGLGGGAWEAARYHFQSYYYKSTQVHNHFAQTLMEVGYIGLIIFISLWPLMLYMGFKNLKKVNSDTAKVQWLVMVAALALGAHAVIDFDLALSSITIVLYSLFGITAAIYSWNYPARVKIPANIVTGAISGLVILAMILLPSSLMIARDNVSKGIEALKKKDMNTAIEYFEKAALFDPFNAEYRIDLAQFYEKKGEEEKARELIKEALQKDKYNWKLYQAAAKVYWNSGKYEEAVKYFEKARDNFKWNQERWDELAKIYAYAGMINIEHKNKDEAKKYLQMVTDMPSEIKTRMDGVGETELKLWRRTPHLQVSPQVSLYAGVGEYFIGDIVQAEKYFEFAADKGQKEALVWLGFVMDKQGKRDLAGKYMKQAEESYDDFKNKANMIAVLSKKWK